jgi:Tfp pilus assembly PilM family ATPase
MAFSLSNTLKALNLEKLTGRLPVAPPVKASKMPEKPTPSPIAVDFGAASLKVLQIMLGTFTEPARLIAAASIETPPELLGKDADRLAFQVGSLAGLLKGGSFKGRRAVCAVSARRTFVQHVQLPLNVPGSVADRVREQVVAQASCDPNLLIIRHVEAGEVKRQGAVKLETICFVMPRDAVVGHMDALRQAKLECVGVHSEHQALVRTFDPITKRDDDDKLTSVYLDLGATTTKMCIAHGRRLVLAKTIQVGWAHLRGKGLQALGAASTLAQFAAGAAKHEAQVVAEAATGSGGASPGMSGDVPVDRRAGATPKGHVEIAEAEQTPQMKVTSAIEQITDEIGMGLRYHAALFPGRAVSRAVFVGGGACDMDLCRHIAKKLRLAAQIADPISTVDAGGLTNLNGLDLTIPQPGWAVPLGLCLSPTDL